MASERGGISGLGVALMTGGGLLIYAAVKKESPLTALQDVIEAGRTGKKPPPVPEGTFSLDGIGGGDFGGGGSGSVAADGSTVAHSIVGGVHPEIAHEAGRFLGRPYVWGGVFAGNGGGDCSGLVYRVFINLGDRTVPRLATSQMLWGRMRKIPRNQVGAGDLTYWPGAPAHIGIAINNTQGIYAPHTGTDVQVQNINRPRVGLICLRYSPPQSSGTGHGLQ